VIQKELKYLSAAERAAFQPYLRGNRFVLLADSLLADEAAPILARYGIKPQANELARAAHIATLPELVVMPSEDGNRRAERGEHGGRRLRFVEGMLAPPGRVSPAAARAASLRRRERAAGLVGVGMSGGR